MTEIETAIHAWIAGHTLNPGVLTPASRLMAEGWLDSIQIVQLVEFLERHYSVAIDLDEIAPENFETVPRVANLIQRAIERQR